ncbi:TauD/TfdA family dioxygenase [Streptomyces sp. ID05-04B]|uniref:TauD/TfdA dioxygenase family protein n=1 Tax=unclassified Streptomyces TaxID=2593676 RepID=UPI000D1BEF47|nr:MULTISPECIES: TauD/TfdA family dioxygenase [unclassified Streptomyces]AVV45648.1 taurine catabolism dioxygenase TauD [Streptomyces sp. P3]MDX5562867.1 TauD/TfdA family dioxygenase [Streptomyces sp. ID05-04B]
MIDSKALSPALGVEFTGVNDPLDDSFVHRCAEALKWRGVLLVRGLHLDDERQLAFSRRLGDVVALNGREIFPISIDPEKSRTAKYLRGAFFWHLDGTTDDVPVKATTLTARQIAMTGGGTDFASTYAAYENLPEKDRERLDALRVVHSFEAAQRLVNPGPGEKELAAWRARPTHEVSLVWRRRDGRRSLVTGATADHVVGMDPAESRALLDELLDRTTQERFRYTHEWEVGDLVVWDNTGILHRALPYAEDSERLLHRTTVVGDEAFA